MDSVYLLPNRASVNQAQILFFWLLLHSPTTPPPDTATLSFSRGTCYHLSVPLSMTSAPIPETTKTYARIKTYPIAASWIRIGGHFPASHVVRPQMYTMAYSPAFRDYTEAIDSYFDNWLEDIEKTVPEIKTLRMRDIRDSLTQPVVDASLFVDRNMHSLSVALRQRVIEPARRSASDLRKAYAPLYDTHGRALIRSQLDPLFRPINKRLASYVHHSGDNTHSSEMSHTLGLLSEFAEQTRPRVAETIARSGQLPNQVSSHLNQVYQTNKAKRGEGRLIVMIASMDTVRDLVNEGYTVVNEPPRSPEL
ncbi:hypothetical protein OGAPHI_003809 [Ogataea philodendri]|uniref:Uncharacterized protein n=1 Tax=Ogataea philodendri TaxID=1378263 RepID=A0A9P8P5V2_9ASCO|nr:uncharacterized protein OGAPHI_003809 [Ogataea philodendri]KAH3665621.1 hypothetical protein OGAPHI_003809 [Ogataea philodendri]